ncbi:hypothetical protein [Clostridium lacusfryxellense]|uniref:hypothetical protein n=1 Tax=Clostridium lacusfryxellense TaxID=205328 RepID=UPI001C0B3830|nr:hypothetical protein [Clostridium lacusfryxellense]MBU3114117.1 hypothetical protein [Clostridium lacusfryxellense]
MEINNFYNFKNTVRHFLNINNVRCPVKIDEMEIKDLAWTKPINFRVRKQDDQYRTLKMPNVLNFLCAYKRFKDSKDFLDIYNIDNHKRLVPNLDTGDFAAGTYDEQLENDFQELCIYDNLLKLDIKGYYERIYAHDIKFENKGDENYLTNLNTGNTNGLIMGNYISLYFAEKYLKEISNEIEIRLKEAKIECSFSYFSDDFYFFCDKKYNENVISIFDTVLEKYSLERNDGKTELWTYLPYNNYHLIEKYWKKIRSECKRRFDKSINNNKLYFSNQLIYRVSNLKDDKLKKTFLNTFFKSTYFQEIDIKKYAFEEFNYHQLCYIFKFSPETMLYSINHFKYLDYFSGEKFKKFLRVRYNDVLSKYYNEEQLYYYYTIKILGFDCILKETVDIVVESNNQLLVSYYLKDDLFNSEHILKLKLKKEERYWFQNYHLILFSDLIDHLENSISEYLMPAYAIKDRQKNRYMEFYKINLESSISLVKNVESISGNIKDYMELLIEERIEVFGETGDEN